MAHTDPTGAPSSANPKVPSVRPRRTFTCGMCAVHDANNRPCIANTPVTAIRDQRRVEGVDRTASSGAIASADVTTWTVGSDTVNLDAVGPQPREHRVRRGGVGDNDVECRQLADHR
jgi:hypothetical protein